MKHGLRFENMRLFDGTGWCDDALCVNEGLIVDYAKRGVDLNAFRIAPGIIDLHGDGFERHVAPRRGVVKDLDQALYAVDAELAANGITTAYLAQFWSWEGGQRAPDFAKALAKSLRLARHNLRTDMRLQLRVETHLVDDYQAILDFVAAEDIQYVVLNDHLPHAALRAGKRPARLTGQALKSHRAPEAHLALMQALHAQGAEVAAALPDFVAALKQMGCHIGSHDDMSAKDRTDHREIGAEIAEFPMGDAAVIAARASKDPVIFGAPNVIRGGSHDGRLAVADYLQAGDVLVSDYHYPAQKQAALIAARDLGFEAAWDMIAANPARVIGLQDRGHLAPGQRADLCFLDTEDRVVGTMVAGKWSYLSGALAEKMIGAADV
ncbi:MAG: alpha-D-ribose 1-methylphosphonate 5-triphosphate diphosphatase [Pseudomonadota bacterium]